ncbi:MAG TPA: glycosyltransferase family 4 protein [Vicinamibacterales bacterium]|nr:glycosyltransferase family 4 protein [Vicinamibacterales bacterium]
MLRVHATGETELAFQAPLEFDRDQIMRSLQRAYHYFLMRRFVRRAPVVLSTNPYHLRFVKEVALASNVVAISRRRFFVVPNTTDPDVDATVWNMPTPFVDEILRAGGRFLLSLGRLDRQGVEQKGVVDLLDALALARRHDPTMQRVFLVVVGDGDQRGALRDRAKALGLDAVVILPGHLPQASVFALTRAAHAVVLLSRYEGLAMFALESLALGAPLVVSRTGGLSDLVIEGRNGFTAEPHDPVGAAEALRRVLEASRNSMSAASREVFASRFAARRTLETFMDVLSLIAPSPLSERVEIELEAPPGR